MTKTLHSAAINYCKLRRGEINSGVKSLYTHNAFCDLESAVKNESQVIELLCKLVATLTNEEQIIAVTNSIGDTITEKQAIEYLKKVIKRIDPLTQLPYSV